MVHSKSKFVHLPPWVCLRQICQCHLVCQCLYVFVCVDVDVCVFVCVWCVRVFMAFSVIEISPSFSYCLLQDLKIHIEAHSVSSRVILCMDNG